MGQQQECGGCVGGDERFSLSLSLLTFPVDLPRISACAYVIFPLLYKKIESIAFDHLSMHCNSVQAQICFVGFKQKTKWNGMKWKKNVCLLSMKLATTKI